MGSIPANCPHCSAPSPAPLAVRSARTTRHNYSTRTYDSYDFIPPNPTKKRHTNPIPGRSPSAPTRDTWPGPRMPLRMSHVPDLTDFAWTNPRENQVCLAYRGLDRSRITAMEGLIIDFPNAVRDPQARLHFNDVKSKLETCHKPADVGEATGEAAAALHILKRGELRSAPLTLDLAGFHMLWGMHTHSGPGFDQIWRKVDGIKTQYLIVEAKAPFATLSINRFMPPDFEQMGIRWVMHNLKAMISGGIAKPGQPATAGHQIGTQITNALGLVLDTPLAWKGYAGASKSYYACTGYTDGGKPKPNVELYGVTITANWLTDGPLDAIVSDFKRYTKFMS